MTNHMKNLALAGSLATSVTALGLERSAPTAATTAPTAASRSKIVTDPTQVTPSNPTGEGIWHLGKFFPTFDKGWKFIDNQSWQWIGMDRTQKGPIHTPAGVYTPHGGVPAGNSAVPGVYNGNGDFVPRTTGTSTTAVQTDSSDAAKQAPLTKEELKKLVLEALSGAELEALLAEKKKAEGKDDKSKADEEKPKPKTAVEEDKPKTDGDKSKDTTSTADDKPKKKVITNGDFMQKLIKSGDQRKAMQFIQELKLTTAQKEKCFADWEKKDFEKMPKDVNELVQTLAQKCIKGKAPLTEEQRQVAIAFISRKAEVDNKPEEKKPDDKKPMSKYEIISWLGKQLKNIPSPQIKQELVSRIEKFQAKDFNKNVTEAKLAEAWKGVVSEKNIEKLEKLLVKAGSNAPTRPHSNRSNTPTTPQTGKATEDDLYEVFDDKLELTPQDEEAALAKFSRQNKITKADLKKVRSRADLVKLGLLEKKTGPSDRPSDNRPSDNYDFTDDFDFSPSTNPTPTNGTEKKQKEKFIRNITDKLMGKIAPTEVGKLNTLLKNESLNDLKQMDAANAQDVIRFLNLTPKKPTTSRPENSMTGGSAKPATEAEIDAFYAHLQKLFGGPKKMMQALQDLNVDQDHLEAMLENATGEELQAFKKMRPAQLIKTISKLLKQQQ